MLFRCAVQANKGPKETHRLARKFGETKRQKETIRHPLPFPRAASPRKNRSKSNRNGNKIVKPSDVRRKKHDRVWKSRGKETRATEERKNEEVGAEKHGAEQREREECCRTSRKPKGGFLEDKSAMSAAVSTSPGHQSDSQSDSQSVSWSVGRSVGRWVGRSVIRSTQSVNGDV